MIRPTLPTRSPPGSVGSRRRSGPLLVAGVVIAGAALVYHDKNMTEIVLLFGINAIMVIGFQIFVGNTGLVSFGHVAFMALGAYGAAIVSIDPADKSYLLPDLPGFLEHMKLGVVPSLSSAASLPRVRAPHGRGSMRLSGARRRSRPSGFSRSRSTSFRKQLASPWATLAVRRPRVRELRLGLRIACRSGVVERAVQVVRRRLRARANRDDLVAAEASGVGSLLSRLIPFVLSAFLTGVGGALYGMLITAFSPASFTIALAVVVLTMSIIGGVNSITGAIVGAAASRPSTK